MSRAAKEKHHRYPRSYFQVAVGLIELVFGYHPDECAVGQGLGNQQGTVKRRLVSISKAAHVVIM